MELGIDLIDMATKAAAAFMAPGVDLPAGPPSTGPRPMPDAPSAGTTVSPTIQTAISPQISPTMVQQQSSPGATVQAAPTMYPGAQTAVPMGAPGLPIPPMGPPEPQYGYAPQPYGPQIPWGAPGAMQTGAERVNWTLIALAGAVAIVTIGIFGKRRPRH